MKTAKLKINGMHCVSCSLMIDGKLEDDLQGVKSAQTHYARQECMVEYDEDLVKIEDIITAIEQAGYKACVSL